jgi:hypothetical protein
MDNVLCAENPDKETPRRVAACWLPGRKGNGRSRHSGTRKRSGELTLTGKRNE